MLNYGSKMMTRNISFGILLFLVFNAILLVKCQDTSLSPGAKQCFNKHIKGQKYRRVKLSFCERAARLNETGGYPFNDLEIRIGNVLFNTNPKVLRTILLKETTVQICMFGKLNTDRLRSKPAALQFSAHGKPESLPIGGITLEIPLDVDTDFCDINADACVTTEPSCNATGAGQGIKEFCSCSTLKVPAYAPAGTDVQVTWKMLEVPSGDVTGIRNDNECEQEFDMDTLWNNKQKETLACLKIPAKVKACSELQKGARKKIDGC
jgi:hypothetical protein